MTRKTRSMTQYGVLFAKMRIDLQVSLKEFANTVEVSPSVLNRIERDAEYTMPADAAIKLSQYISANAPQYSGAFAAMIAEDLSILVIPEDASEMAVEQAFFTLQQFDAALQEGELQKELQSQLEAQANLELSSDSED